VAITGVVVDSGLQHAVVYFDTLAGADADVAVLEAFADVRGKLKVAIGRQARVKSVPDLEFRPDDVERGAERIEGMLRELDLKAPPQDGDKAEPSG
jgi:ribosome-binding factor A